MDCATVEQIHVNMWVILQNYLDQLEVVLKQKYNY